MKDLTKGKPMSLIITFAIPMIVGNMIQQLYNVVDSIVVGRFIGSEALAAVSSSFTIMVFITSIIIGLCMGAGVVFSKFFGAGDMEGLRCALITAFTMILAVTVILETAAILGIEFILEFMNIPAEIYNDTRTYLQIIFLGIIFVSLYNGVACLLRALGDSKTPLYFLILSAILNIVLDLLCVLVLDMGVDGVAIATVIAQVIAGILCAAYAYKKLDVLHIHWKQITYKKEIWQVVAQYAFLTAVQQSIMNLGILLVQGLVNSFGTVAMAAFGAATKIDAFAYMPVQDFGNAFSTYVAQNEGAGEKERVYGGIRCVVKLIIIFCAIVSTSVIIFAEPLMHIFISKTETDVVAIGVEYLHVVAPFYVLIGFLFMYYGFYRAIGQAQMSIVLTIISLGIRVLLAYALTGLPGIGLVGAWWAIPIGWALADITGLIYYYKYKKG